MLVAWDTETKPFRPGRMAPEIVCGSWAWRDEHGNLDVRLLSTGDSGLDPALEEMIREAAAGRRKIVTANGAYDLSVLAARRPDLLPAIFAALDAGQVEDVILREKLLDLGTDGDLSFRRLPDGSAVARDYSLAGLEKLYIGRDRSDEKVDEDAWRTNYAALDGVPSADWPDRAAQYAKDDADGTLRIHEAQAARAAEAGLLDDKGAIPTEHFHVGVAFALRLIECWGMHCDLGRKSEIQAKLAEELRPERMKHLLEAGILRPAVPGRIWNGRMTKGRKESINRKALIELVVSVSEAAGIPVKRKDPTEKMLLAGVDEGNVSTDKNVLAEIGHLHPALDEYRYRQYLSKLVNTELPRMSGPVIYTRYNLPVESGRTSAGAMDGIPSANVQNISAVKTLRDERGEPTGEVNIRECFIPRPMPNGGNLAGKLRRDVQQRVICSIDFAALEFCSMAQVCYELFGYSVMRDLIADGRDPHAYLGAQIALHQHAEFAEVCADFSHDPVAVYEAFKALEHHEDEENRKLYKTYRKLAKPVGFGFPGGLGIKKFVAFAAAHPYYVKVTEEQAKILKEIWMRTFPEMRDYFAWVERQADAEGRYSYTTPFGMVRAGCVYTEMCNGRLLQSPAAEGAKLAVWSAVRNCYDETLDSVLLNQRVLAFIHDELLFEFTGTQQEIHDAANEAARLMVEAMSVVLPDVKIGAKPALMWRWNKDAEPVYTDGLLDVWEPVTAAA